MIFGMSFGTLVTIHVAISLVAIAAGFVAVYGFIAGKRMDALNAFFLVTTLLTSVSGFAFPYGGVTPAVVLGVLSLIALALAGMARYVNHLSGRWRSVYTINATVALYFNVFVGVVQAFRNIPALKTMAPTESEPPFVVAQVAVLALFTALGIAGTTRFRKAQLQTA